VHAQLTPLLRKAPKVYQAGQGISSRSPRDEGSASEGGSAQGASPPQLRTTRICFGFDGMSGQSPDSVHLQADKAGLTFPLFKSRTEDGLDFLSSFGIAR
jgi:hypothetical protein